MPNMIAWAALIAWPLVTIILFARLTPQKAVIWSLVGAYLLLPVNTGFDLPGLPAMDKTTLPNLAALLCAMLLARRRMVRLPQSRVVLVLMAVFILSPFITALGNRAPVILSQTAIPGMTLYDGLSASGLNALSLIPFVLGYSALNREADYREMLRIMVIAALIYSIPILYEVRFAPVLHQKIYGIAAFDDFSQFVRFGGFRPAVFMGHGLLVSMFCSMALTASAVLWRMKIRLFGLPAPLVTLYLVVILILIKSVGAILLAVLGLFALLILKPRRMVTAMFVLSVIIVTYPAVRASHLVPVRAALDAAGALSQDRANSLAFRFDNEERLLARAQQKPLFGWGTWGRNQVYQATDWGTDIRVSTADGSWVIAIGQYGWVGYIAMFGLLCHPVWRVFRSRRANIPFAALGLLLILMLNLIDLIPNASLRPLTWLIAGALSGMVLATARNGREVPRKPA